MPPTPHIPGAEIADARLRIFADSLSDGEWTSALLKAYNPTGATSVSYEQAKAALVADLRREALAVPEGMKLVPVEPSEEMLEAYQGALRRYIEALPPEAKTKGSFGGYWVPAKHKARVRYAAMLAASPVANVPPQVNEAVTQWRCAKCDCRTFARMDTRLVDTSWGPGDFVRCVNCKDETFYPAFPSPGTATAGASAPLPDSIDIAGVMREDGT